MTDTPRTDNADVRAAQRHREAFAPLYERYADAVYGYCLCRLSDPELAADTTADVFTRALATVGSFRGESFRSWLFTIARNAVIDRYRARKPAATLPDSFVSPHQGPEEIALQRETRLELRDALTHLTDQQQDVITLRLAGLTGKEIAADLCRKELDVTMPPVTKNQIAASLQLEMPAPVSNRTRRERAALPARQRPRWMTAVTVALAALLALTGVFQWSMRTDNGNNRFGVLSPAVPTTEATPAATPAGDIGWLNPIMWDECPDDVASTSEIRQAVEHPYLGLPDRAYGRYTSPAAYTRGEVLRHARELRACGQLGRSDPSMSSRMVYEMNDRDFVTSDEAERFWASQIVQGKELSAFYASEINVSPATLSLVVPADAADVAGISPGRYVVINPDWIVQLADGRVVVLVSMLTVTAGGTPVAEPDFPTVGFGAWIFVQQDGEWLLDELLPVCFGECDAFWDMRPGANLLVTPAPTPTISNDAEIVPVGGDSQIRRTPTTRPSPTGTEPPEIQPIDVTPTLTR